MNSRSSKQMSFVLGELDVEQADVASGNRGFT
jgi:hypothetical protein